jgi:hypothetical protein
LAGERTRPRDRGLFVAASLCQGASSSGRQLVERAIKFIEENFMPQKGETAASRKKKVVPFRAA